MIADDLAKPLLYVEPVDFSVPVFGSGNAAVASSAIANAGDRFVFVGLTSTGDELGRLLKKRIGSREIRVYFVGRTRTSNGRSRIPLVPENLAFALRLLRHLRRLRRLSNRVVFTRTYTVVWALVFLFPAWRVMYYIPGLGNPMLVGRRPRLGRFFAKFFEYVQFRGIGRADLVWAAASTEAISSFSKRMSRAGVGKEIHPLPTAVDVDLFRPTVEVGDGGVGLRLVFVGRLAGVKNIPFLLDVVSELRGIGVDAKLDCIGDGEERSKLEVEIRARDLSDHVALLGNLAPHQVSLQLRMAHVFVMASFTEGFSNAMLEALACGLPIVCTDVSGARDIVTSGKNGYVLVNPSPKEFADRVLDAWKLEGAKEFSRLRCLERYSDKVLWERLLRQMGG